MNLSLIVPGGISAGILALLDQNLAPITGATFANIKFSGLDGSIATAVAGAAAGEVDVSPVAAGSQTLQIDTDVTYTDTNAGLTTVHKTVQVLITVTAKIVLQATTLSINFGPQAAS